MDQIAAKDVRARNTTLIASIDGRRCQPRRSLRCRLQLRIQQHAFVAHSDSSLNGGKQSSRRFRTIIRRERQHGCRACARDVSQQDRSILDSITDRVKSLQRSLGASDNRKVNDYLESLRDVERRIQKAEEQSAQNTANVPSVERPVGIPDGFERHVGLLYDLQLLAFQSDLTRVTTFMYGREQNGRPYPQIGVPEPHHPLTHHQDLPEKMEKCAKIQTYHVRLFADYLEKLRSTPDGDGSLLDHVILLYGGGISHSDRHTHGPLPTLVVGGGAGTIKGGRHLVYPEHTPLTNLQLTLLGNLGVPTEKFGDSTGQLKELAGL